MRNPPPTAEIDYKSLARKIRLWGRELGFQQIGISAIELGEHEAYLQRWLALGRHGKMEYMQRHGTLRSRPGELVPGTIRVISGRMDYWPADAAGADTNLANPNRAYISRYALGGDYHKLIRNRLQRLADKIEQLAGPFGYRAFTDSAPVLEKALAQQSGIGWIGKHTNLINEHAGSWFFLGELYTNLPLPADSTATNHCGTCHACIDVCPTDAIIGPYELDARLCISYLTIELRESIPVDLRSAMGNRIYGCDDCQLICPWNRFARNSTESAFRPRNDLDTAELSDLFSWDEEQFLRRTEGSAIRRIGHVCWLRNIAVALGNASASSTALKALKTRLDHPSPMVREHVEWALQRQVANETPTSAL